MELLRRPARRSCHGRWAGRASRTRAVAGRAAHGERETRGVEASRGRDRGDVGYNVSARAVPSLPPGGVRRQRSRLGAPKAITATAHKLARSIYNVMRFGLPYMRQQEAAYAEEVRDRLEQQLHRRAKELGYELVKPTRAAPEPAPMEQATSAPPSMA